MIKKYGIRWVVFLTIFCLFSGHAPAQDNASKTSSVIKDEASEKDDASAKMLFSVSELKRSLTQRITEKRALLQKSTSNTEKENLEAEIAKLDEQLSDAKVDFERIATGVDIGLFLGKKDETFNWKEELVSLVEPGIKEIKRMTVSARNKTKLRDEVAYYENLADVAKTATKNIGELISKAEDKEVKKNLEALLPEWKGIEKQITNKLHIANMQLSEMNNAEKSLIESSGLSVKKFFRTRGLYLVIALAACILSLFLLKIGTRRLIRMIPGFHLPYKPFHIRLFELLSRLAAMGLTLFVLVLVFYIFEDWVLLSFSIVFFMGFGWAVRNTLPQFWKQSCLMLNIGAVREGERMLYQGVPWMVKSINIFCVLENPYLETSLRLPIEALLDQVSRPVSADEPWFACKKNEWVLLSDGTWGKVKLLSHEMVEIKQPSGTRKNYQTAAFLALAPVNLSRNFTLKSVFGLSYDLQKDITDQVPRILQAYIREAIQREGYETGLLGLQVEFQAANASSLDLAVIADFRGEMAPSYYKLSRAIQRWCVEACNMNQWEIPFPQLRVHH